MDTMYNCYLAQQQETHRANAARQRALLNRQLQEAAQASSSETRTMNRVYTSLGMALLAVANHLIEPLGISRL